MRPDDDVRELAQQFDALMRQRLLIRASSRQKHREWAEADRQYHIKLSVNGRDPNADECRIRHEAVDYSLEIRKADNQLKSQELSLQRQIVQRLQQLVEKTQVDSSTDQFASPENKLNRLFQYFQNSAFRLQLELEAEGCDESLKYLEKKCEKKSEDLGKALKLVDLAHQYVDQLFTLRQVRIESEFMESDGQRLFSITDAFREPSPSQADINRMVLFRQQIQLIHRRMAHVKWQMEAAPSKEAV